MTYLAAILIIVATMLLSSVGVVAVRRLVPFETLRKHHETAAAIFLQIGVMYGVLLAFVVSLVWIQMNLTAPDFVWALLVVVGAMVVGLSYLFGVELLWPQIVLTSALAGTIVFTLMNILLLDYPFSGDLRVRPEPLELIVNSLKSEIGR